MSRVPPALPRLFARAFFSVWMPLMVVPGAYLLGGHTAGLPAPAADDRAVERAVAVERWPNEHDAWLVLHVLYGRCGCSRRVLDTLVGRGPAAGVRERVVLVDAVPGDRERALGAGFAVTRVTPADLAARFRLESAPLFVVADPAGRLRYLGGYTERKRGPLLRDAAVVRALRRGEAVEALPVLGCAVSRRLQSITDPLGVR
jgi:hypothetical protein